MNTYKYTSTYVCIYKYTVRLMKAYIERKRILLFTYSLLFFFVKYFACILFILHKGILC